MIEIKSLSKSYGKNKIISNITFTIANGNIFGFLGPNGAGKSTTMKIIVGINKPDSGSILIGGKSPLNSDEREIIGYMPEEPTFYNQLTGIELLKFSASLFKNGLSKSLGDLEKIMAKVGIAEAKNKKIKTYSKGMKQRLGFAQALVNDPQYIFLDEPLEGLDPIGRKEIKTILLEFKKEGRTVFFNSHILADVENICDQIGIIAKGKLVYTGSVNEFRGDKSLEDRFVETLTKQS